MYENTFEMKFCEVCGRYFETDHTHEIDVKLPTSFRFEHGRKDKHGPDYVLLVDGIKITIEKLGIMVGFLCRNEDSIYPPSKGFEGGKRLKRFMDEVMDIGYPTKEIMKRFFLN